MENLFLSNEMKIFGYIWEKCSKHLWILSCRRNLGWTNFHYMSYRCFYSPGKPLKLYFKHINKKITYSNIYNWELVVILKDTEMFSLKVTNVAPPGELATFVNCAKNCSVLYRSLLLPTVCPLCESAMKCIPKPPTRWFNAKIHA